ncbi:MAG: family 43 glycosylhydrolase [Armatimonadota bacterium]
MSKPFPAKLPPEKPTDRPLSRAMERLYDVWNRYEDRGNELFSNFKYSRLEGFSREPNVSRRDPSKVIRINGTYYVYYTCRRTEAPPAGPEKATDTIPSRDWDLAEVWYATSEDGFHWTERGPTVTRPAKGEFGWRSNCTPDILVWKGRYYLYHQAYSEVIHGGDSCPVTTAEADSPDGPWQSLGRPVVEPGAPEDWDAACIHDPFPLVYNGKIHLYYKGSPGTKRGGENIIRAQGVAIAEHPAGPFEKSPLNPVLNSGHETCLWPYRSGIAALVSLDGPEKNTVQYAPDGVSFEMMSLLQAPPIAPGPFVPDAFADNGDGRGFTWGLCHINPDGGGLSNESILARFDCDLSRDVDRPLFNRNNLRFDERTYFQPVLALPGHMRKTIERERAHLDTDTISTPGTPGT